MFTPTLRCECAQPGLIDTMRKWSTHSLKKLYFGIKPINIGPMTGYPKSPLTTLNLNSLKIKSRIAKPNTYLKTRGLHNFFDTRHDVRTSFTRDL